MFNNVVVVYKRNNKWCTGTIKEDKLRKKKDIEKLSDVTETENYITLKKYIKDNKIEEPFDDILAKFKITSLYIKAEEAIRDTQAVPNKTWWANKNSICLQCPKKCKQSSYAIIVSCNRDKIKKK